MNRRGDTLRQLLRYGVVGLALNGIGYLFYLFLTLQLDYDPLLVVGVMYPVSVGLSFAFNRSWTFGHQGSMSGSLLRFLLTHVAGYFLNLGLLFIFWQKMGMPHPVVQAMAILLVAVFLFVTFRLFVFKNSNTDRLSDRSGGVL